MIREVVIYDMYMTTVVAGKEAKYIELCTLYARRLGCF
jgi:hypothetical protein